MMGIKRERQTKRETREIPYGERADYTAQKVDEMLAAPSASADTKKSAQAWKDAIAAGKDADAATNTLLDAIDRKSVV